MTIDLRRRQKVMARSQALQHCVCDPAKGHATQASAQAQMDCLQDLEVAAQ